MKNTLELEQQILHCWNVVDELDIVSNAIMERDLSRDETCNLLIGIKSLYDLKFQTLFETFENSLNN